LGELALSFYKGVEVWFKGVVMKNWGDYLVLIRDIWCPKISPLLYHRHSEGPRKKFPLLKDSQLHPEAFYWKNRALGDLISKRGVII